MPRREAFELMATERVRILVVDDSALYRQMIRNVLRDIPAIEVVGAAKNGTEALQKIQELKPDAITLDYEMPGMNGIQVLRRMKRRRIECKAIMVSSYTEEGAKVTTDALLEGAFDFIQKPTTRDPEQTRAELKITLLEKLMPVAEAIGRKVSLPSGTVEQSSTPAANCEAIVIGTSTGGPIALRQVLPHLPGDLSVPIIVVQHMPAQFTAPLARRLNELCQLEVVETENAMRIRAGAIYVAAGGRHTKLVRRDKHVIVRLTDDAPENSCRPSVDYTLRSAAEVYKGKMCAIIMTGMGHDGLQGCRLLKQQGGFVIAQHPEDCVVYGMPKSVIEAQLSDQVLRLDQIAEAIKEL